MNANNISKEDQIKAVKDTIELYYYLYKINRNNPTLSEMYFKYALALIAVKNNLIKNNKKKQTIFNAEIEKVI